MNPILFFLLFPLLLIAKPTICLNMIVKNERPVILKGLATAKPIIDYWVIVDTGSTDGTQEAIREFMKDIPGELHERPWVGFSHNRNEALELARGKANYCLILDADQVLVYDPSFKWPELTYDLYAINIHLTHLDGAIGISPQVFLISQKFNCHWIGILHETIKPIKPFMPFSQMMIQGVHIATDMISGNRSQDPKKYLKDAATLRKGLETEPDNARYQFHLGSSYEMAGDYETSLKEFEKCAAMKNGDPDEHYRALFQIGILQKRLNRPPEVFLKSFERSYAHDRTRAEPLFYMANYYIEIQDFKKAYGLLKEAVQKPIPQRSFVEGTVYTWAALYNLTVCSENLKKIDETYQLLKQLLLCPEMPAPQREITKSRIEQLKKFVSEE